MRYQRRYHMCPRDGILMVSVLPPTAWFYYYGYANLWISRGAFTRKKPRTENKHMTRQIRYIIVLGQFPTCVGTNRTELELNIYLIWRRGCLTESNGFQKIVAAGFFPSNTHRSSSRQYENNRLLLLGQ